MTRELRRGVYESMMHYRMYRELCGPHFGDCDRDPTITRSRIAPQGAPVRVVCIELRNQQMQQHIICVVECMHAIFCATARFHFGDRSVGGFVELQRPLHWFQSEPNDTIYAAVMAMAI